MKRVLIVGSAGAGKSRFAILLSRFADLPVIHLDSHYWKPGWVETSKAEWQQCVESLISRDKWIIDGNYGGTLDVRLDACDTVFCLEFPMFLCLFRVFKRALVGYGRSRPDLNQGCREHLPDFEFLKWIWTYPKRMGPGIREKLFDAEREGKRVIIVKQPRELSATVEKLSGT